MRLETEQSFPEKTAFIQAAAVALLYFLLIICLKGPLQMTHDVEFRVASFVPVTAGLMFGLPGAVGACIGNMLADLFTGMELKLLLLTGPANFFLAYIPFRLWYNRNSKRASLFVYNNRTYIKFLQIIGLTGFNFAVLIGAIALVIFGSLGGRAVGVFICNNVVYPLIFGIPILLYFRRYSPRIYVKPKGITEAEPVGESNHWQAFAALGGANLLFCFLAITLKMASLWLGIAGILLNFAVMAYVSQAPSTYEVTELELHKHHTLSADVTMMLLTGADAVIVFIMLLIIAAYFDNSGQWTDPRTWAVFYNYLLVVMLIFFSGVYLILEAIEKKVTRRLRALSASAVNYVRTGNLSQEIITVESNRHSGDTVEEIALLEYSMVKMGKDIDKYINGLSKVIASQQNIKAQLDVAASIQQSMLPKLETVNRRLKSCRVAGGMQTARSVGGDMYDCFFIDDENLAIMVADVSGKGVPASLFMTVAQSLIRNNAVGPDPGAILTRTNATLAERNEESLFVTMWLGVLRINTGRLFYANAGHNPPLIQDEDGVRWIRKLSGPVLGLIPDCEYTNHMVQLKHGTKLLLYTDGINEAENTEGEFYGNGRLQAAFTAARQPSDIINDVAGFTKEAEQSDDMTYLWIDWK